MSITGLSSYDSYKNPSQWRNHSGELDVFEAARYFSGANECHSCINNRPKFDQNFIRNGTRMSLDIISPVGTQKEKQMLKETKKCKQPSSPGARLASFLNSLFSQKSLKKKILKSSVTNDLLDEEEQRGAGLRRKIRRSSISHFPVASVAKSGADTHSKPVRPASRSGFTTPSTFPYVNTPTKSFHEFKVGDDDTSVPGNSDEINSKPGGAFLKDEFCFYDQKRITGHAWVDEKFRIRNGISVKLVKDGIFEVPGQHKKFVKTGKNHNEYRSEEREFRRFSDADSDSSSDLFDLPNHGLDLPVYETTRMESVKKKRSPLMSKFSHLSTAS